MKPKLNQLRAGVVLTYVSLAVGYLVSMVFTPVMIRMLGQNEYGLYTLVLSIASYLNLLNFGFGASYMRFYARCRETGTEDDVRRLNGLFLLTFAVIAVIALTAGLIVSENVDLLQKTLTPAEVSKARVLIRILSVNLAFTLIASVFTSFITAQERFIFQKSVQIFKNLLSPLAMLAAMLLGYASLGLVTVTLVLTMLTDACNIWYCIRRLGMRFRFKGLQWGLFREIAVFSSFIFINIVVDQINWNVGNILLAAYHGTLLVSVYGLASQLNTYYVSFSTAVSAVFVPKVNQIIAKNSASDLTDLFIRVGRVQFLILMLVCTGFILFGKPFIAKWGGPGYEDAYYVALMFIVSVTIPSIQNIGIEIQRAKNMHRFRSLVYIIMAAFNVAMGILLCPRYGTIGCAIGTALSLILGNGLVMNIYYHRKIGLDMVRFWKNMLSFVPALLPPLACGVLMALFVDTSRTILLAACIGCYALVYCASMWFLGMNAYEKDLVRKPLGRILRPILRRMPAKKG